MFLSAAMIKNSPSLFPYIKLKVELSAYNNPHATGKMIILTTFLCSTEYPTKLPRQYILVFFNPEIGGVICGI